MENSITWKESGWLLGMGLVCFLGFAAILLFTDGSHSFERIVFFLTIQVVYPISIFVSVGWPRYVWEKSPLERLAIFSGKYILCAVALVMLFIILNFILAAMVDDGRASIGMKLYPLGGIVSLWLHSRIELIVRPRRS